MRRSDLARWQRRLGFVPRGAVRWLAPGQLLGTALKVGVSQVLTGFLDRREVQAALPAVTIDLAGDAGDDGAFWLDYLADTGDGFDATYTVAWLVTRRRLHVEGAGELPRGALLVLGGDEVYPTPSAAAYEDRFAGPFRAALTAAEHPETAAEVDPAERPGGVPGGVAEEAPVGPVAASEPADPDAPADPATGPLLMALPGNHDWYDGLTAFLRLFAQRRDLGGWRTGQTRSYGVVRLPARWWLVLVDTQLGTYVDDPQVRYLREHLTDRLRPGDGVIFAVPTPTWVHAGEGDPAAYDSLLWLEREVVTYRRHAGGGREHTGASVRLWITGDRHHFSHYAEDRTDDVAPRHWVTCGLGGAYLLDTHRLPEKLLLPPPGTRLARPGVPVQASLRSRWPDAATSRRLARRVAGGPPFGAIYRNPGLWQVLGAVQAVLMLIGAGVLGAAHGLSPTGALALLSPEQVGLTTAQGAGFALAAAAVSATTKAGRRALRSPWISILVAQSAAAAAWLTGLTFVPWPAHTAAWEVVAAGFVVAFGPAAWAAGHLFGLWILWSKDPEVRSWQMSAQAHEDHKGFMRVRIAPDGTLTLYPVVVERVVRRWRLRDVAGALGAVPAGVVPVPDGPDPAPRLAADPIVVRREG